jgi:hypothetical protein
MEGERSLILDVVGDETEVSWPEATMTGSLSGDTSSGRSRDGTDAQGEESGVVDPREFVWSYDFGASIVTVGHFRQLEALGYFAEGFAREPREEVVLDPANDEAVVCQEFFCPRAPDAAATGPH